VVGLEGVRLAAALLDVTQECGTVFPGDLIDGTFWIDRGGEGQEHPADVLPVA
jgi:hypothetical protein